MINYSKLFFFVALPLMTILYLSQPAVAETGYCTNVTVKSAGANNYGNKVLLQNTRADCGSWAINSTKWFFLDNSAGQSNAMLAASLSALALDASLTIISKLGNDYPLNGTLVHIAVEKPLP